MEFLRRSLGFAVAHAYRATGARARAVGRVKAPGALLPIVFHASKAAEVRSVLGWLRDAGCLDRAVLTFDDGWREFMETVGVLEDFNKHAILFIAPGESMRGRLWTDGLGVRERQALYPRSEGERYGMMAAMRGPCARTDPPRLMCEEEIRAVAKHPLVEIGNHTWSHLSCTHRPVEEVVAEIDRTQDVLEAWTGVRPRHFAYPFGRGTPRLDALVRARGLTPWYTRQGLVTEATVGSARNMVREGLSLAENIGRILMAWPKVGETL